MLTQKITHDDEAARAHQARLRAIVKRAVIDLGYLEPYIEQSPGYCSTERMIATCLNTLIDTVNGDPDTLDE